jgi:hypothetical protein
MGFCPTERTAGCGPTGLLANVAYFMFDRFEPHMDDVLSGSRDLFPAVGHGTPIGYG